MPHGLAHGLPGHGIALLAVVVSVRQREGDGALAEPHSFERGREPIQWSVDVDEVVPVPDDGGVVGIGVRPQVEASVGGGEWAESREEGPQLEGIELVALVPASFRLAARRVQDVEEEERRLHLHREALEDVGVAAGDACLEPPPWSRRSLALVDALVAVLDPLAVDEVRELVHGAETARDVARSPKRDAARGLRHPTAYLHRKSAQVLEGSGGGGSELRSSPSRSQAMSDAPRDSELKPILASFPKKHRWLVLTLLLGAAILVALTKTELRIGGQLASGYRPVNVGKLEVGPGKALIDEIEKHRAEEERRGREARDRQDAEQRVRELVAVRDGKVAAARAHREDQEHWLEVGPADTAHKTLENLKVSVATLDNAKLPEFFRDVVLKHFDSMRATWLAFREAHCRKVDLESMPAAVHDAEALWDSVKTTLEFAVGMKNLTSTSALLTLDQVASAIAGEQILIRGVLETERQLEVRAAEQRFKDSRANLSPIERMALDALVGPEQPPAPGENK